MFASALRRLSAGNVGAITGNAARCHQNFCVAEHPTHTAKVKQAGTAVHNGQLQPRLPAHPTRSRTAATERRKKKKLPLTYNQRVCLFALSPTLKAKPSQPPPQPTQDTQREHPPRWPHTRTHKKCARNHPMTRHPHRTATGRPTSPEELPATPPVRSPAMFSLAGIRSPIETRDVLQDGGGLEDAALLHPVLAAKPQRPERHGHVGEGRRHPNLVLARVLKGSHR
ncbi:hypothetical protein TraAM80_09722 [Trypanosoma rangeli]|uniref:Uncharacterized protein n=1 Tax=Trypanosoma rangeli TaxID=5698 RepID=A0A3R7MWW8_TRYRA|nr:uncharacterized protein TraAM80_09722 [Trypanosoma rangeli]RNE96570.1 hypothetical protein TraAM80_09722 [Trypanosoma rangeli]|eukprot:RNE96570.1 hypothetical protein TraAM80_09722 [Trypanosoma rangeli]